MPGPGVTNDSPALAKRGCKSPLPLRAWACSAAPQRGQGGGRGGPPTQSSVRPPGPFPGSWAAGRQQGGRGGPAETFTPAALAGAVQTCKFIGHELRQLAFTAHSPCARHRAWVCVPFPLTLTPTQRVLVTRAVPVSQMKTLMETLQGHRTHPRSSGL